MPRRSLSRLIIIGIVLFLVAGFIGFQLAIRSLKGRIEQALGPQGEVREIQVGLTGVEIHEIRIQAKNRNDWPVEDELRAKRIVVTPDVFDLLRARLSVDSIRVEGAYVSMLRTRSGQVRILPSLLGESAGKPIEAKSAGASAEGESSSGMPQIRIGKIELADGAVEFIDASIRSKPVKFRIEQISAAIGRIQLPELNGQTSLDIKGVLKGDRQDGKLSIDGSIELASKNSGITTKLRGIDMTVLQPYLIRAAETGVRRGTLDLDLKSSVAAGKLRAPGTLTLSDLELSSAPGSFMGLPRDATIALMKGKNGKISVKFLLEGDINDPRFSLNEQFATRLGASVADSLGISLESLAKGVGSIGGSSAKSIGESVGKLFRK